MERGALVSTTWSQRPPTRSPDSVRFSRNGTLDRSSSSRTSCDGRRPHSRSDPQRARELLVSRRHKPHGIRDRSLWPSDYFVLSVVVTGASHRGQRRRCRNSARVTSPNVSIACARSTSQEVLQSAPLTHEARIKQLRSDEIAAVLLIVRHYPAG